ncbi:MAG: hypothetical protein AABY05_01505 [Nanoarchaeota archaeon]
MNTQPLESATRKTKLLTFKDTDEMLFDTGNGSLALCVNLGNDHFREEHREITVEVEDMQQYRSRVAPKSKHPTMGKLPINLSREDQGFFIFNLYKDIEDVQYVRLIRPEIITPVHIYGERNLVFLRERVAGSKFGEGEVQQLKKTGRFSNSASYQLIRRR